MRYAKNKVTKKEIFSELSQCEQQLVRLNNLKNKAVEPKMKREIAVNAKLSFEDSMEHVKYLIDHPSINFNTEIAPYQKKLTKLQRIKNKVSSV